MLVNSVYHTYDAEQCVPYIIAIPRDLIITRSLSILRISEEQLGGRKDV
jgi:hypothetical protein